MRIAIKFIEPYHVYAKGDVAAFDTGVAEQLIKGGFATRMNVLKGHRAAYPDSTRSKTWTAKHRIPADRVMQAEIGERAPEPENGAQDASEPSEAPKGRKTASKAKPRARTRSRAKK